MAAAKLGLGACIRGRRLHDVALEVLDIAADGLKARAHQNLHGEDERLFLDHLYELASSRRTPAEEILEKFESHGGKDTRFIYRDYSF